MESVFSIAASLLLAFVGFLYVCGWLSLQKAFPHLVSFGRLASFLAGVLLVWLVLGSPIAGFDHQLLSAHMIQHLLLMAIGAPLILLGVPGGVLLHSLPKSLFRRAAGRAFQRDPVIRFRKILSNSMFCWLAGTITVVGWHIPAVFELGHHSMWWHGTEHATFLIAGLFFWWPVVRPWPSASQTARWSVPLYLFLATLPCDALSAYLVFCDHVVYHAYLLAHPHPGLSALQDQQWAGALMWVGITFIYIVPAVGVTSQLLLTAPRRAPAFDATVNRSPKTKFGE